MIQPTAWQQNVGASCQKYVLTRKSNILYYRLLSYQNVQKQFKEATKTSKNK